MSKKKKKPASRLIPSTIDRPVARPSVLSAPAVSRPAAPSTPTARAQAAAAARPQRQALVTDYRYVMSDLKRIGVVAITMFVIIILLSFVIR